jgi:RNA polymerase sigma-70 factor (ECF subfamily)
MSEFHELYQRHYRDVYRFALFLTGNAATAEDLAADTFVRAWVARDRIHQPTVRAYLLTIARNLHRDQLRQAKPMQELDECTPDPHPGVDVQTQHRFTLEAVRAKLQAVPSGDRRAFLMFIARGMSYSEIAATLGVSVGAVKSRIFRAREAVLNSGIDRPLEGESQ